MATDKKNSDRRKSSHFLARMRRHFVTGILILMPMVVSLVVVKMSIDYLNKTVGTWLPRLVDRFTEGPLPPLWYRYFQFTGYVVVTIVILFTGMIASWAIGRRLIAVGERLMARVPFISRVYLAVVQMRNALVQRKGTVFLYPVLTEYPRQGVYVIGFVTAEDCSTIIDGDYLGIFVPTTPNPTSGFLIFVLRDEVKRLDITTEDAMKLVISGAAYMPGVKDDTDPANAILMD